MKKPLLAGAGASARGRFAQLDALRAFAVVSVVACHTLDPRSPWANYGSHGVRLFFVMSGFLITGILLDARAQVEQAGASYRQALAAFFARRLLRICPVYYLTLVGAALLGMPGLRANWPFYVSYLTNWKMAFDGYWHPAAHLWSLAVEQQFYVLWPFVVFFVPRRLLPWIMGSMVLAAPILRLTLLATAGVWGEGVPLLTPATFDSLGLGALLALAWRSDFRVDWIVNGAALVALPLFILELLIARRAPILWTLQLSWPFLCVWCVHRASRGVSGPLGRLLSFRPLLLLGTVSYGVYLFHVFVGWVGPSVARHIGFRLPSHGRGTGQFVYVMLVSTFGAIVSYALLERPINRLKSRFPYPLAESSSARVPRRAPKAAIAPEENLRAATGA